MFWARRRFAGVDYGRFQDLLEKLLMAHPQMYAEFIMVSTETPDAMVSDYYVGVPLEHLLAPFEHFEHVSESQLPKIIDSFPLGDATKEPFKSRFKFRHDTSGDCTAP